MIYKSLLICVLFHTSFCSRAPVLMFGSERSDLKPSLNLVSEKDFSDVLANDLKDSMFVAFIEENLTPEDLSHCKTNLNTPCFHNLKEFSPKTYYTSVDNPVDALRKVAHKKEYAGISTEGGLENDVSYEPGKAVFLNFEKNFNESRQSALSSHGSLIAEIYRKLSKLGKVVVVYTGSGGNALSRQTRETPPKKDAVPVKPKAFIAGEKFLIYFTELKKISEGQKTDEAIDIQDAHMKDTSTATSYDIELVGDKDAKLSFQIKFADGYWSLQTLVLNEENFTVNPKIIAAEGFSYYCGIPSQYIGEKKTTLIWSGLQMQPFRTVNKNPIFDDPWHCVGFTSAGIWAGLFVTFMLLGIMSIGISWLMDIKTMDRFDDPKGKTITINAGD